MAIEQQTGRVTFLRVHDVGGGFGPPGDTIDGEVIVQVQGFDGFMGFQLRTDGNRAARQGMLDLLRDAFADGGRVTVDIDIDAGKKNARLFRVARRA